MHKRLQYLQYLALKSSRSWLCLLLGLMAAALQAQTFPSKPMKLIAPYAVGGAADLMARYVCEKFQQASSFGQPCVVENRTGAGGIIGMEAMLKADADGHTLAMMPTNLAIIPGLYPKVPYDTLKDVAPIALVSSTPVMIGVHPAVPAKSFAELITWVRANDGKANFTTCGPASPQHLGGEILGVVAGMRWTHVPYKGCGAAMADVLSGTVPVFISTYAHFAPQIKAGKLRGLVMTGPRRSNFAPEYPTVIESGYAGYELDVWFGMVGSARLPQSVQQRLNAELNRVLQQPDLRDKLLSQQYEPVGGTAERFAEVIRSDIIRYTKVVRDIGIRPE